MPQEHDSDDAGRIERADVPSTYERPRVNPGIFIAIACVALVVGAAILGISMSGGS